MSLVKWSEEYATGIDEIDGQHRELFAMINSLGDAMAQGRAEEETGAILSRMYVYAAAHFRTEEEFFRATGYPASKEHVAEHRAFVEKLKSFADDHGAGRATPTMELMAFLGEWLGGHVKESDKAYAPFLKARGF